MPPVADHSGADGLQRRLRLIAPLVGSGEWGCIRAVSTTAMATHTAMMMPAKHTLLLGGLHAPAAGFDVFLWNASQPQRT